MKDEPGPVEHRAALSQVDSFDLERENNAHRFMVAEGVGKSLGRIKHKPRSWPKMKELLSEPLRDTSITFAKYMKLEKKDQLEYKRQPGSWTPSRYSGERRHKAALVAKTLVVYDLDYITDEQLDDIRSGLAPISAWAWHMHTTRSHCPEKPRVRLTIPISREMAPDEANAVYRLLALQLADDPDEAIEIPDPVSFRGNQAMFWPSVCKDQEFWADENDMPIIDVDELLAANPGWDDFLNLPHQAGERNAGVTDPNRRMEDPHEKPDPIGAFCRAYTVEDVIENWLDDIYAPGDSQFDVRYSYLPGGSANGAIVYEDGKFLHSHHGTDPVETANAYDLLRIHKFGHLDEGVKADTSPGNMPSAKAMSDFCYKDTRTLAEMNAHLDDLMDDFDDEEDEDEPGGDGRKGADDVGGVDTSDLRDIGDGPTEKKAEEADGEDEDDKESKHAWRANLKRKVNNELLPTLNNVVAILENDPRFNGRIAFNEFTQEIACLKQIRSPGVNTGSKPLTRAEKKYGRLWADTDDVAIRYILSLNEERKGYNVEVPINTIEHAVSVVAGNNTFHPIKTMFEAAREKYIQKGRKNNGGIDTLFIRYLGVPDNEFNRQASRNFMIAMVARTYEPGCKFDNVVVIQGKQGGGKSTFLRVLSRDFFVELPQDFGDAPKMVESMSEALIAEMGEMAGLRKETAEKAKEFITRQVDKTRLSYDRRARKFPRKTILTGTSNLEKILHDPTGNRRFWVMRDCHDEDNPIDIAGLKAELNDLQGEALDEYLKLREAKPGGELNLDLRGDEARRIRDQMGEQFREQHAWEKLAGHIEEWLNDPQEASRAMGVDLMDSELSDEDLVVPNRFTRADVMRAMSDVPEVKALRNLTSSAYDAALQALADRGVIQKPEKKYMVAGVRRYWITRKDADAQGPLYVRADEVPMPSDDDEEAGDPEVDEMLG